MNQTENQCDISNMVSLVPLLSTRKKISSWSLSVSLLTSWNFICLALLPLHSVLNLILATNPIILSLPHALLLWFLTGCFFVCPSDLLICFCCSELCKLLTHPVLFLRRGWGHRCTPCITHCRRMVPEQYCLLLCIYSLPLHVTYYLCLKMQSDIPTLGFFFSH